MKRCMLSIFLTLLFLLLTSCKSETNFLSHPIGYGQVDSNSIASLSFDYLSQRPNNPNSIQLDVYALPHKWAEVKVDENFDLNNPNIEKIVDGYLVRYYAKYILIGDEIYTLFIDQSTNPKGISYKDDEGIDIISLMNTEEACKSYIEEVESNHVYMVTEEGIRYDEYSSILVTDQNTHPIVIERSGIQISYVGENETMPDLWLYFKRYDRDSFNELFDRAHRKALDPEFKIREYN